MIQKTETLDSELSRIYGRVVAFIELAKLRLVLMVLITTFVGFYLASPDTFDWAKLIHTTISIGLAAGGVLALNQYLEREQDAQMARTRHRPLPDKRLQPIRSTDFRRCPNNCWSALSDICCEYTKWIGRFRHCCQLSLYLHATEAEEFALHGGRGDSRRITARRRLGRRTRDF